MKLVTRTGEVVEQDTVELWRRTLDVPMLRWSKDEMAPLIDLLPFAASVAELGCFAGECSLQFLQSPKVGHLICVDNWKGGYDADDKASGADMEAVRLAFDIRTLGDWNKKLCVFNGTTLQAATVCMPLEFDLVYIDADHRYHAVKADIKAWFPKVKPGGILAGHDYDARGHPDVKRAVDELFVDCEHPRHVHLLDDTSWYVRVGGKL